MFDLRTRAEKILCNAYDVVSKRALSKKELSSASKPYMVALGRINDVSFQQLLCSYEDERATKKFRLTYDDMRAILLFLSKHEIQIETGRSMEKYPEFKTISFAVCHEQWYPFLSHAKVIKNVGFLPNSKSWISLDVPKGTEYVDINNHAQESPEIKVLIPKGKTSYKPVFLAPYNPPCHLPNTPANSGVTQVQNGFMPAPSCAGCSLQSNNTESQHDESDFFDPEEEELFFWDLNQDRENNPERSLSYHDFDPL